MIDILQKTDMYVKVMFLYISEGQDIVTHSGLSVSLMGFPQSGISYVQIQTLIQQHPALIL